MEKINKENFKKKFRFRTFYDQINKSNLFFIKIIFLKKILIIFFGFTYFFLS
jgi:hypothetical protein